MTLRSILAFAVAAATSAVLAAAPSASQDLLQEFLGEPAGVCTCAVVTPPNNCTDILRAPTSAAREQQGEVRRQCASDWQAQCEAQYGWRQCASEQAIQQKNQQCDALAEQWWSQVAQPQMSAARSQCNAANAGWVEQCNTVTRPQSCETCDGMKAEIADLETRISDDRAWVEAKRSGESLLTAEDDALMAQRLEDIRLLERELADKASGYALLQDSEFCPADDANG